MFVDALGQLSDAQALSATGFSTNTIDLSNVTPKIDIGIGEPMCIAFAVDVAADTASGDETYTFQFVQSANANLSSPDILAQVAIARATLVAGYKFYLPIPSPLITKRFIGVQYTLGGTTPSITVTAFLQPLSMVQNEKVYAKGYTIS
jgi:hypothetical protein